MGSCPQGAHSLLRQKDKLQQTNQSITIKGFSRDECIKCWGTERKRRGALQRNNLESRILPNKILPQNTHTHTHTHTPIPQINGKKGGRKEKENRKTTPLHHFKPSPPQVLTVPEEVTAIDQNWSPLPAPNSNRKNVGGHRKASVPPAEPKAPSELEKQPRYTYFSKKRERGQMRQRAERMLRPRPSQSG